MGTPNAYVGAKQSFLDHETFFGRFLVRGGFLGQIIEVCQIDEFLGDFERRIAPSSLWFVFGSRP